MAAATAAAVAAVAAHEVTAVRGVLLESDAPTIVFLQQLHEATVRARGEAAGFVLGALDTRRLFVRESAVEAIKAKLAARLRETTFDDEAAGPTAGAGAS